MNKSLPLYVRPYCTATFSSITEGWSNAMQHIKAKHGGRGANVNTSGAFYNNSPRDNLFGSYGTSTRGSSL